MFIHKIIYKFINKFISNYTTELISLSNNTNIWFCVLTFCVYV